MKKNGLGGLTRLRVLLIEASTRDTERLLEALRGGGHDVYFRRLTGRDELATALRDEAWDIVLLCCSIPELPPAEAIALIQRQAPELPVILTIEGNRRSFPTELLEIGACDFVFKRNPIRLLMVVERECSRIRLDQPERELPANSEMLDDVDASAVRFFQLASNTPECYWLTDARSQRITYVSKGYEQIWGRHVESLYADPDDLLSHVVDDDRESLANGFDSHRQGGLDIKFRVQRPNDTLRWLHVRTFPIRDESGEIISVGGVASDISSLVAQRKVPYFAHFDALTALPNQLMFYDQARHLIALAKRRSLSVGVMVIDLDRFREVNKTLGHTAGDELLRQVAGRLSGSLRESDTLGRLGGDVFAVLLPDLADAIQAGIVANRILETLMLPVRVEGQDVFATASIGIAFYPHDGKDVHELVSNSEVAVRRAKTQGRNVYQIFSPEMNEAVRDRLLLETDLRNASLRNEFILYYQPKVSCANGRITGVEALLRWQHPQRGIVPPDQFISLLEETGLIVQVGRWVLEEACRQTVEWQEAGLDIPSVSVNLSARQLQSDLLLDAITRALAKTGLKAACLDLEITESMLMHDAEAAIRTLSALKETGVTISLDDFGTGYSSLAYLRRFPLDAVKVDRSFVQDIAADSDDASITRAVITMAHHLKLKVVAEGVETSEQLALLISHQCDIIQGYFFSRPLPPSEMAVMLNDDKRLPANLLRSGTRKPMVLFVGVEGFDEVVSILDRDGHRVRSADSLDSAMQWFTGNLVDVLVCGASDSRFDAVEMIVSAARTQPQCERILLANSQQWRSKSIAELSSKGLVSRVIQLPLAPVALRQVVEEAINRRHVTEEFGRLSHEVEIAERELVRIEEERRRLQEENQTLHAQEALGYQVLQEVMAELPWPVLGVDEDGMLALINEAAYQAFADRDLMPGAPIEVLLPEIAGIESNRLIAIAGGHYLARWRDLRLGGAGRGRLLLLEARKP